MRKVSAEEFSRNWRHLGEPVVVTVWGRPTWAFGPYTAGTVGTSDQELLPTVEATEAAALAPHAMTAAPAREDRRHASRGGRNRAAPGAAEASFPPPESRPPAPVTALARRVAEAEGRLRARVVHGWAFRDHSADEVEGIRTFLDSGDTAGLPARYHPALEVALEPLPAPDIAVALEAVVPDAVRTVPQQRASSAQAARDEVLRRLGTTSSPPNRRKGRSGGR